MKLQLTRTKTIELSFGKGGRRMSADLTGVELFGGDARGLPAAGVPAASNGTRFAVRPLAEEGRHFEAALPEFQVLWLSRLLPEGHRPTTSSIQPAEAAALTVTLSADGSTKIAGKLGTLSANASGYAGVTGLTDGVIFADFAPVVSIKEGNATFKRALSIRVNLWFDRSNAHPEGVGSAKVVE